MKHTDFNIANHCPYEGGTAVFKARELLAGVEHHNYDDKMLCEVGGNMRKPLNKGLNHSTGLSLYPNPANYSVTLSFAERVTMGKLNVTDVFGRLVFSSQVEELTSSIVVDTEAWPNGIYQISLSFDGEGVVTKTLVISH